jgi:hypothetical protein
MARLPAAVALALLSSIAAAEEPLPWAPQPPPSARPAPPPAAAAPPAQAAAPAQPAPPAPARTQNEKAVDEAKSLGKKGVLKVAPKLGKAEKLVTKQGGHVLDQAIDLLADKSGFAPVKKPAPAAPAQPPAQPAQGR